jgi:hypothetical protein
MEIVFWVIVVIVALVNAVATDPTDLRQRPILKSMGSICRREENFMTTLPERLVL